MNKPAKMWARDLNRQLTKDDIQLANKHMKICGELFVIVEL